MLRNAATRTRQRGLSLVEMMVGVAVGLIVVAGASLLISSQLNENRRLLVETQLQQDLRASLDIITRELRRTGALRHHSALQSMAVAGSVQIENTRARRSPTIPGAAVNLLEFEYEPSNMVTTYGFRLNAASGALQSKIGGTWQDLTDSNVMRVTAFSVTPSHSNEIRLLCQNLCPDPPAGPPLADKTSCWPQVLVRDLLVSVTGQARNDPAVARTLTSQVRVRNDYVRFNVLGPPPPTPLDQTYEACPS